MPDQVANPVRQPGTVQGFTLLLVNTLVVMGVAVLTSVIPLMQDHFKAFPYSDYAVPVLMTVPALWIFLLSPAAGWLSDRIGRRPLLISSMVAYAVVGTMPIYLDDIYAIFASRCGLGICEAILQTVATTMIGDYFSGRAREKWLAANSAVASLSVLVIIPLGGVLGSIFGWRGPFYAYIYSLILVAAVLLFTWEPSKADHAGEAEGATDATYQRMPWLRISSLCVLTLVFGIGFYAVLTQNGNMLATLGVSQPAQIALLTMACSIGVPVGSFLYSRIVARLHIGLLLFAAFALVGIGFWFMGNSERAIPYTCWAFVNQIGCGIALPALFVWTTRGLAHQIRGLGTGLWLAAFNFGQLGTAFVMPYLSRNLGGLANALSLLGELCLVIGVGAVVAKVFWGHRAYVHSSDSH